METILNKPIEEWISEFPLISQILEKKEVFWENTYKESFEQAKSACKFSIKDVEEASDRLNRFAPYIAKAFPQTADAKGIIESPIQKTNQFMYDLAKMEGLDTFGQMYFKLDSHLPISGSIKARGGIYEVLKHAEDLALKNGILKLEDPYDMLLEPQFKNFFSNYKIAVGSTGNLGLSIGIMSAKIGFDVTVHMSADARQWKKDMLRSLGVHVIEYKDDYGVAVENGRKMAERDSTCHFIDDENSTTLFMGYTVAALRLKNQLIEQNIIVDAQHPLFVYLPCGVGGGPGGVAFGLKMIYGDNVHCFFAEPTHSPCMLLGMYTHEFNKVSVQDFGLDNKTAADGLAVGRCSSLVAPTMLPFMSGCFTVEDDHLYKNLALLADKENLYLEPSALAGSVGPNVIFKNGSEYIKKTHLDSCKNSITHLAWATGGSMVPEEDMHHYYKYGKSLLK